LAPAKVNLYLHVTGKRDDGYHLLDSLVVFAGLGDTLTIGPASELRLSVEGPRADGLGEVEDNLVMRAARLLAERRGLAYGAEMTLAKTLPVGAGLGGGSAGAAAALSALIRLWKQNPGRAELMEMALELGADVPVCLAGRASLVSGIGEKLSVAPPLPDAWLVLANPGVTLATPDVFGALDLGGGFSDPNPLINAPKDAEGLGRQLALRRNDLTRPAISFAPGIARVLDELEGLAGCRLARMSGSGATCFALMDGAPEAAAASLKLSRDHRDWWVAAAPLLAVAAPGLTD
ncbi:MAG: 4-(cytidine 5'-diphospho)-2-C-methyl-D-erythritol kinase, partial [Rhodospirillales bacterium]|nr:4-(cytidine 5'-diphospho)-2-C-methyl-D-erythritol kinase [Rhodospirillales bacterium]